MLELWEWLLAAVTRELMLFALAGLLVGGVDDLAVDLLWIGRALRRRLFVFTRHPRASLATLPPPAASGRLAVFVPAWKEGAVIGAMLAAAVARLDHPDYRLYVGTYPNDPDTVRAVRRVRDPRVRLVGGDRPGPTTKAECLNRLWAAMVADERASGVPVKAVVLHDAEDVVHPQELALYDRMIERFDLVQIPVLPLAAERRPAADGSPAARLRAAGATLWARTVSATYGDEFAEAHGKSLAVREAVGASVPSAGVGCAIARGMLARVAAAGDGRPFDEGSLTEDYELGLRLRRLGGRSAFVTLPAMPGGPPVAVRAHFPESLDTAVRQKARWMTGIALAGWDRLRWEGGLAERWMRLRDRRTMLAAVLLAASYLGLLLLTACRLLGVAIDWPAPVPALFLVAAGLLAWRLAMRALAVARAYGWRAGLLSVPRVLVANLVDMAAARRALAAYVPGRTPAWDKTAHVFPAALPCD